MKQESFSTATMENNPDTHQSVQKILLSFVSLFKVYSLYPADHAITGNNFTKFKNELDNFLSIHEILRLETRQNNFYYEDETVFTGTAEENNPAYLLARDGIEFIEFVQGITSDEISDFVTILIQYRTIPEDIEGDIVTALWQNNFSHISYQEVDIFTLESFDFNLSTFKITPEQSLSIQNTLGTIPLDGSKEEAGGRMENSFLADAYMQEKELQKQKEYSRTANPEQISKTEQNIFLTGQNGNLLKLSTAEKEILKKYTQEQENKSFSGDVIEVLLIILVTQHNKEHFASVLEFFKYEFWDTLKSCEFNLTYKLLNNLQIIREQFKNKRTWSVPLLDDFFSEITDEGRFKQLGWIQKGETSWLASPYLPHLLQVLRMLSPKIICQLGSLLLHIPDNQVQIRDDILKIIDEKAKEDPEEFRKLMTESDQRLILLLAPLLEGLPKEIAAEIYLQMSHHDEAEVRRKGLDGYLVSSTNPDFDKLFHLLGDKETRVRVKFINYLKNTQEKTAATLLIRFLSKAHPTDPHEQKIIYRNYKALASCKSFNSLPFLEKNLLNGKLGTMFANNNAIHKKGAAHALKLIGTNEAYAILEKGTKSLRPDIRYASRSAMQD